jgi:hypothetical protein
MPALGEIHFMIELGEQPSETSIKINISPHVKGGFWRAGHGGHRECGVSGVIYVNLDHRYVLHPQLV